MQIRLKPETETKITLGANGIIQSDSQLELRFNQSEDGKLIIPAYTIVNLSPNADVYVTSLDYTIVKVF